MGVENGQIKNLTEGGHQAFRALVNSLVPEAETGDKLTPDQVEKLTEKLKELVGDDAARGFHQQRNEKGELVNEEGLPILDISEPILHDDSSQNLATTPLVDEEPVIPLSRLPSTARERLRQQRDRILDALEEEERSDQLKGEEEELERMKEIVEKRKQAAANEKEKTRAAKELQKKMGKALLKNIGKDKNKEQSTSQPDSSLPSPPRPRTDGDLTTKKRTVAFADDEDTTVQDSLDWGDITPARLRSTDKPSLLQTHAQNHPMKLTVVERTPSGHTPNNPINVPDSDDESEPEISSTEQHSFGEHFKFQSSGPPDSEDGSNEEVELESEDFDSNYAHHQREIALAYHRKRSEIGQDAANAMMSHTHDDDDEITQSAPLDMPVADSHKPSISKFKATRIASAYNASTPSSTSTSLGASVLPASSTRTIQRAIRVGKIDVDQQLVGGEADSASDEETERIQEVLDLLKRGEIYNIGPDGEYVHAISPLPSTAPTLSAKPQPRDQPVSHPPLNKSKPSKFKAYRAQTGRTSTQLPTLPPSGAFSSMEKSPVSYIESKQATPADTSTIQEHHVQLPNNFKPASYRPPASSPQQASTFATTPQAFSMIVDSPTNSIIPIIESASFAPPPAFVRPKRPPTVISSAVKESQGPPRHGSSFQTDEPEKKTKISRFMADRM